MKALIERYVRSVKERDDFPEQRNDLGAILCWILEREGFTILERAFKHEAHERRVSKGRVQYGVDVLAVREEEGQLGSYRFVLKRGDVRKWTPGETGSMGADLWLAASDKERERRYGITPDRITVVAVHNGDRDSEALGPVIEGSLADLRAKTDVRTEWWDASRMVEKIESALAGPDGADASFFPPALQPFVRLTLDSLLPERGADGSGFDHAALDVLVERRLALRATGAPGAVIENLDELHRRVAELALVASMIVSECERVGSGNTLPALDTLERILCGAVAAFGMLPVRGAPSDALRGDLRALLSLYTERAERLRTRLLPLLATEAGLALPTTGEAINYPLRAFRLSGYIAVAGLAASADGADATARGLADALKALWNSNAGAFLRPATDDQLIEIVLIWELWTRVGLVDEVIRSASQLVEHLAWARALRLPLPALWQRARVPMRPEDLAVLVETRLGPRAAWPSAFSDGGSTILSAAVYVVGRRGAAPPRDLLDVFRSADKQEPVFPEVWAPPDDAGARWYREELDDGITHVLTFECEEAAFSAMFEAASVAIAESTASRCGFDVVDRMAWKVGRTPPPMSVLVGLVRAPPPTPEP